MTSPTPGGGRLEGLFVYPVKGCAGVPLDAAKLDDFGLAGDRRWMVVDEEGAFLSQREEPRLALVHAWPEGGGLRLDVPGGTPPVAVPEPPADADEAPVTIWDDVVVATFPCSPAHEALSTFLGRPVRLARMPHESRRPLAGGYGGAGDRVSFVDAFPFLLVSLESLDALNARLDTPVGVERFRPNLVVTAGAAHAEDAWRRLAIGRVAFEAARGCARCSVTTVDPRTGERGKEPLRTLAGYRAWEGKTWFGQNLIHRGRGTLRVGDPVRVLESGEPRPPLGVPA